MSASAVISQLRSLQEKAEQLLPKLSKLCPTEGQWVLLGELSENLSKTGTKIGLRVLELKNTREDRAWQQSEKHRLHALACIGDLLMNGRLKHSNVFRRNIIIIFEGPKYSIFDDEEMRMRKDTTRRRCEQIQGLTHDGVISWAIAFPPSLWAGGSMANDIFACLLDNIEPDRSLSWPPVIRETLHMLREDQDYLRISPKFGKLLEGSQSLSCQETRTRHPAYDIPSETVPGRQRKRRRTGDQTRSGRDDPSPESNERRGKEQESLKTACNEVLSSSIKNPNLDRQQTAGISASDTTRYERTGINNISALLNHDNITPAAAASIGQVSTQDLKSGLLSSAKCQQRSQQAAVCGIQRKLRLDSDPIPPPSDAASTRVATTLLRGIRFEKCTLQHIVIERPNAILGGIWFGGPQGYPPFVSLRLSRALDDIIRTSGQDVYVPGPSPEAGSTVTGGALLIKLGIFRQMIQRDGFGPIYWNECGGDAFISMEVIDEGLAADFVQGAILD